MLSRGGAVNGVAPANLAGRDGGSGWGLKALADHAPGARLIELPASCHLTYDGEADPKLLALIDQVPEELWGAKLALQVRGCLLRKTRAWGRGGGAVQAAGTCSVF